MGIPNLVLCNNIAAEAIHNSQERCDAPKVHPDTRKAVQEEIFGCISHGEGDVEPKKILWMSGPAGSGKTAIAGSIAELCEEQGLLAGSFFFSSYSGSEKRRTKRCVVATLVYSLLRHKALLRHGALQSLRKAILSVIEHDPAIFRTSLRNQCRMLLVQPFYDVLALDISTLPMLILLDGLDEVLASSSRQLEQHDPVARLANEADQVEILAALLQAAHDPKFPFRIIVASRPERVICDFFATKANHVSREIFLDDKYDPDFDIALFLNAKFAEIRRRYRLAAAWPGEDDVGKLVANASGQFIYADTVVRFLKSGKRPNPQLLLRTILDPVSRGPTFNALAPLDALYDRILMSSPDPPLAARWIGVIEYLGFETSAVFVRQLLQDFEGQAEYLLENLASLVHIPLVHDVEMSYEIYHKSLLDFLSSARRCGQALKDSYAASLPFFCDRWFGVLKAMSPVVPLTCSQWPEFLCVFLGSIADESHVDMVMKHHSCEGQLANCDVGGRVRATNDHHKASRLLSDIFNSIHDQCTEFRGGVVSCSRVCRHWRSNILGECKALGWVVPDVIAILYRRFVEHRGGGNYYSYNPSPFQPPMNRSHSQFPPPRDSARVLVSRSAYLDEYNAQYEIIDSILDGLPAGWKDQAQKDMESSRRTTDDCIRRQLRKVRPELLLRLEGLNAWVRLSDAYGSEDNEPESENEDEGEDDGSASEDEDEDDVEGSGSSQNEIRRSDDSAEREDVNMDESTDLNSYSGGDHGGGNIELNETVSNFRPLRKGFTKLDV